MYLVAAFFAINLALSELSSESFFSTKPSPLHCGQTPEPPQSSQIFVGASAVSEASVLLLRRVAAAPTMVAATAIEAAVSGRAQNILHVLHSGWFNFNTDGE